MGKKIFTNLTCSFSADIPRWPYFNRPPIDNAHTMTKGGVLTFEVTCTMYTRAHCDAPRRMMEHESDGRQARYTHEMSVDVYTGDVVCLPIDIESWGPITGRHLDDAYEKVGVKPKELEGMVVYLNMGMHRFPDDSKIYYRYSIGTGVEAGKWFVEYGVRCVTMDSRALDHPLHAAIGNNGMTRMNLLGTSGRPPSEEYKELSGKEVYIEFDENEYISIHRQKTCDEKFGELEALGCWGIWEPCRREPLEHDIAGVESLGRDLDKVNGKRFCFYCSPLRWCMGGGSMARCTAEIGGENLTDAPDRTYKYGGTDYQGSEGNGNNSPAYIQRLFGKNK